MANFEISVQYVNCGPVTVTYAETRIQADEIFEQGLKDRAIFAEIFDMNREMQVRVEYPAIVFV